MKKIDTDFVTAMASRWPPWVGRRCVAVKREEGQVLVKDTKNENSPVLSFTHDEWTAFLDGAKKGEFDVL